MFRLSREILTPAWQGKSNITKEIAPGIHQVQGRLHRDIETRQHVMGCKLGLSLSWDLNFASSFVPLADSDFAPSFLWDIEQYLKKSHRRPSLGKRLQL
jgi:hypothetical protein